MQKIIHEKKKMSSSSAFAATWISFLPGLGVLYLLYEQFEIPVYDSWRFEVLVYTIAALDGLAVMSMFPLLCWVGVETIRWQRPAERTRKRMKKLSLLAGTIAGGVTMLLAQAYFLQGLSAEQPLHYVWILGVFVAASLFFHQLCWLLLQGKIVQPPTKQKQTSAEMKNQSPLQVSRPKKSVSIQDQQKKIHSLRETGVLSADAASEIEALFFKGALLEKMDHKLTKEGRILLREVMNQDVERVVQQAEERAGDTQVHQTIRRMQDKLDIVQVNVRDRHVQMLNQLFGMKR